LIRIDEFRVVSVLGRGRDPHVSARAVVPLTEPSRQRAFLVRSPNEKFAAPNFESLDAID
jgi:hypothetical protein